MTPQPNLRAPHPCVSRRCGHSPAHHLATPELAGAGEIVGLVRRLPSTREPAPTPQLVRPELPAAASPRPQPPAVLRRTHAPGRGPATPLLVRLQNAPTKWPTRNPANPAPRPMSSIRGPLTQGEPIVILDS